MTDIKEGAIVTVPMGLYQNMSNTYIVARKLPTECVLVHPIALDCCIIKADEELNQTLAQAQNPVEKCLLFAKAHVNILGHSMAADLDAVCYYFVVKKNLTSKQRHDLANLVGKIASVILSNNLTAAGIKIKQNIALFDEYSFTLYQKNKNVVDRPVEIKDKVERFTLFNLAGFVLAQEFENR